MSGPARIGQMPPSPETNRRLWTMYCRECGVEEYMAESPDNPGLIEHAEKHNAERHGTERTRNTGLIQEIRTGTRGYLEGDLRAVLRLAADALEAADLRIAELEAERAQIAALIADAGSCDKYDDDSPITCGWKSTVNSIRHALAGATK